MALAAHLIGLRVKLVLCVQTLPENCIVSGEQVCTVFPINIDIKKKIYRDINIKYKRHVCFDEFKINLFINEKCDTANLVKKLFLYILYTI